MDYAKKASQNSPQFAHMAEVQNDLAEGLSRIVKNINRNKMSMFLKMWDIHR